MHSLVLGYRNCAVIFTKTMSLRNKRSLTQTTDTLYCAERTIQYIELIWRADLVDFTARLTKPMVVVAQNAASH